MGHPPHRIITEELGSHDVRGSREDHAPDGVRDRVAPDIVLIVGERERGCSIGIALLRNAVELVVGHGGGDAAGVATW